MQNNNRKNITFQTLEHHNLTLQDIIEIDDLQKLQEMINILKTKKVLGLDCEWHNAKNKVDLMQIGTSKKVYLVRINTLFNKKKYEWDYINKKKFDELIKILIQDVFHNKNIIKVSFDFKSDALFLRNRFPQFKTFLTYHKMFDFRFIDQTDKKGNKIFGLADNCSYFLGLKMDKSMQQSDWVRRELRDEQKVYAALDVLVVLELFEYFNVNFPNHKPMRVVYSKSDVDMFGY